MTGLAPSYYPESTWTDPTEACPEPGLWHAADEQATEWEVISLIHGLVRALQPEFCVETGTHRGYMARAIGEALLENGHGVLHTTEVDEGLITEAVEAVRGYPVICHHMSSMDWTPGPRFIDFAWFDSLFQLRWLEFRHYWPWMHDRTIVGFHDTAPHHGDWSDQIRRSDRLSCLELPTPRGVILARVDHLRRKGGHHE